MCNYVAYNRFYKLHLLHLSHKTASDISLRKKHTQRTFQKHTRNSHKTRDVNIGFFQNPDIEFKNPV